MPLASCYLDGKGTEFYLPAYMTLVLDDMTFSKYTTLLDWFTPGKNDEDCALYDYFLSQFEIITGENKKVCIKVINFIRTHREQNILWSDEDIKKILTHPFWQASN